jgi:tetratricopeptide (TPR) repeat protein
MHQARHHLQNEEWNQAKSVLQRLLDAYPNQRGPDNAYLLMAEAHRALEETEAERGTLAKLARVDAEAIDTFARLMELDQGREDWEGVRLNAQRYLAVNPLISFPHQYGANAAEALGQVTNAIISYRNLLLLDPPNPAEVHYRLARLLHQAEDPSARRHVLQALEEAPRFRDAHRLLLKITAESPGRSNQPNRRPAAIPDSSSSPSPTPSPRSL